MRTHVSNGSWSRYLAGGQQAEWNGARLRSKLKQGTGYCVSGRVGRCRTQ